MTNTICRYVPVRDGLAPVAARPRAAAGYNVFGLSASDVYIDLLTDSGTGTMSTDQWAVLLGGDKSYAGSESFERLERAVADVLGFDRIVPAHQGRGAEHLLYGVLVEEGDIVVANTHFDTTRAHVAEAGGRPVDGAFDLSAEGPFRGNLDIESARANRDCRSRAGAGRRGDGDEQLRGGTARFRGERPTCPRTGRGV